MAASQTPNGTGLGLIPTKRPPPLPSIWPSDGSRLDLLDKRISAPFFRLKVGIALEAILSVPGCFFGMPSTLLVTPTLITCATGECADGGLLPVLLLSAVSCALLFVWFRANWAPSGSPARRAVKYFYSPAAFLSAPILGTALMMLFATEGATQQAGSFQLLAWYTGIIPVLFLKGSTRRRRPVASEERHIGAASFAAASEKALALIPAMLRAGDANAAFPSGDVAGAFSMAYVLRGCGAPALGLGCVLLSAFGRLYWQGHHVLDVISGAVVSFIVCSCLHALLRWTAAASIFSAFAAVRDEEQMCPTAPLWLPSLPILVILVQHLGPKLMPRVLHSNPKRE